MCVTLAPMAQTSEAGRFFRPFQRMAERREARGAVVLFPRLRARACSDCGSCGAGAAAASDCPECDVTEMAAARTGRPFTNLVRMLQERRDLSVSERRAVNRVLANPILLERVKKEVGRQFGVDMNNIAELLELFIQYAPQIIQIILQIVSIFAGEEGSAIDCQSLTHGIHVALLHAETVAAV